MAFILPPYPRGALPGSFTFEEWFRQLQFMLSTGSGLIPWSAIDTAGAGTANRVLVTNGTDGSITTDSDLTFDGTRLTASALTVDTDTLYVDATNNRVGIGTSTPDDVLVVKQGTGETRFGGGNGRTLSAYDSGSLANFDFTAVETYFNSNLLIATGKTFKTENGSTGNLLISTDDSTKGISIDRDIILPKTSGKGIKVDNTTPTFGWHDMLGDINIRGTGGTNPSFNVYRGTLRQFQFNASDEVYLNFHIPHDYLPGSNIYIHAHWSLNGTNRAGAAAGTVNGGNLVWGFEVSYAKGHNQAAFIAPVTRTLTSTFSTDFPATLYQHIISETQISDPSPAASQIDTDDIEVDGVIMIRAYLSANNITVASGIVPAPFLHYVDIHYQSSGIPTKQRAPNFYT